MRRYGLIGFPLTHSFSPSFFADKFSKNGLNDCSYDSFPLESIDKLNELIRHQPFLRGLNVTIPYKKAVLPFLHEYDREVEQTGSCNCIKIENGILKGYNTDVTGFEKSLLPLLKPYHNKVLVLGTGGAAAAVLFVLNKLGIDYLSATRNVKEENQIAYQALTPSIMADCKLIINTTPLGMFPFVNESPAILYDYIGSHHLLFDLIYNPAETLFLKKGKEKGAIVKNGQEMLVIQAEESWKIWDAE